MRRAGVVLAVVLATGPALAQEDAPRPAGESAEGVPQLIPPEEMQAQGAEVPASESGVGEPSETGEKAVPQLIPPEEAATAPPASRGEAGMDLSSILAGEAGMMPPGVALTFGLPPVPGDLPGRASPPPPAEEAQSEEPSGPPMREVLAESGPELAACLAALDGLGVTYERADPILDPDVRDCGIANPVTVSRIAPGVAIDPPPTLRCEAALAAARWVADVAIPLSRKLEGRGPLVAIDQGTAYLCRPRADGKLSEHAFGNALDVMGFRFASGDPIPVQPRAGEGTIEEAFQDAVRAGACLDFTTVLGPGSDEDHSEHLHLDVKARERGFRICE